MSLRIDLTVEIYFGIKVLIEDSVFLNISYSLKVLQ